MRLHLKKIQSSTIIKAIAFVVFLVYALSLLYPFVFAFLSSMRENVEYLRDPVKLPKTFTLANYVTAFEELAAVTPGFNFLEIMINSFSYTLTCALCSVIAPTLTAYVLAKYEFPCRNILYGVAIFIMVIPIVGTLPAMYKLVKVDLQIDNMTGMGILAFGGFNFNFFLLYGYFKGVSWSYAEAGFIDGAGHFKVFLQIMLPQAAPAIASVAIISAINYWNDYYTPLLYLGKWTPVLSYALYEYGLQMVRESNYPVYFAGALFGIIPILLIYIACQKMIMRNTVAGGLKG